MADKKDEAGADAPSALDDVLDEEEEKPPTPPEELWAMLIKACKKGDEAEVKNLIEVEGVVPDHRNIYQEVSRAPWVAHGRVRLCCNGMRRNPWKKVLPHPHRRAF